MHATLSDIIADTAQNSIEAGASRIEVAVTEANGRIGVRIADNGKGMDAAAVGRAFDPFCTEAGKHDRRKVGLGLPLLKQTCEACGGDVRLTSEKGVGTTLTYSFDAASIDLPPMGNLPETALALFNYPGDFELIFSHSRGGESYEVSRHELADAVGGLESAEGLSLAREFLQSQEGSI